MLRLCVVVALCLAVSCQNQTAPPRPVEFAAYTQVLSEQMMAQKYLSFILTIQSVQSNSMGCQIVMQGAMKENQATSYLEESSYYHNIFEEEEEGIDSDDFVGDIDYDDVDSDGFQQLAGVEFSELDEESARSMLTSSLHFLNGINLLKYQVIFSASDLQKDFYEDRTLQMTAQYAGLPPQFLQLLYFKTYVTFLKTLKFSQTFQMISHFTSWLEDLLDVYGTVASGSQHTATVFADQADDLVNGKMWAFSAGNSVGHLDLQLMFLEYYLQAMMTQMLGGQQPPPFPASFLEEEVEEGAEPSENQFLPMMMGQNPMMMFMYLQMYKWYKVILFSQAMTSGYQSAMLDSQAYQMLNDDTPDNDGKGEELSDYADKMFAFGFARQFMMVQQIDMMLTMFEWYMSYMAMMSPPPSP